MNQHKLKPGDIIIYNGVKALIHFVPDGIKLKPLSNTWDLGAGAGESITISEIHASNYPPKYNVFHE